LIGEGIARLRALKDTKRHAILLGMAWWGNITEKTRSIVSELPREVDDRIILILSKAHFFFLKNSRTTVNHSSSIDVSLDFDDKDIHSLEKNHTYFLLLDDGKYLSKENWTSNQQVQFVKTINYPKEMPRSDFVIHACAKDNCEFNVKILYTFHRISI